MSVTNKVKILQIRFSPEEYTSLQEMTILSKLGTKAKVIRTAIKLFRIYTELMNDGWKPQFVKDKHIKEIITF